MHTRTQTSLKNGDFHTQNQIQPAWTRTAHRCRKQLYGNKQHKRSEQIQSPYMRTKHAITLNDIDCVKTSKCSKRAASKYKIRRIDF
jgi:hypothetical protein